LHKECAGKQKRELNSPHITEVWHIECASNRKCIFFRAETVKRNGYSAGNYQLLDENPPEEWNSAGNYYHLFDTNSD
jgi:hypothetical protein